MGLVLDLKKEFIAAKAKEDIIGFAGFRLSIVENDHPLEGNLIISSRERNDGSGYLSLTLLVDAEDDQPTRSAICALFKEVRKSNSFAGLGRQFETMIETTIELDKSDDWFMDSFTFYSNPLSNIRRHEVEEKLLTAFEELLPIKFDPIEWLPDDAAAHPPRKAAPEAQKSIHSFRALLKSWLGSD